MPVLLSSVFNVWRVLTLIGISWRKEVVTVTVTLRVILIVTYVSCDGLTPTETKTGTDIEIETNKMATVSTSRCSMKTFTQFYTNHFLSARYKSLSV